MTTIADLSRYDPLEAVDLYDGVILNVEDPGFAQKRDRAIEKGIPWGTYSWVYPGGGFVAAERAARAGTGALGAWLDYEQAGVTGADLTAALTRGDELGLKLGVYTYLYIIGSVSGLIGNHPLWLAYYPGSNDGSYPEGQHHEAVAWGAILWQYTSSNGERDLSRVLDDDAWTKWTGTDPAPEARKVVDGMWYVEKRESGQTDQWWEDAPGGLIQLAPEEAYANLAAGVPYREYPTLGIIGLAARRRKSLLDALPASSGGPVTVSGTFQGKAA